MQKSRPKKAVCKVVMERTNSAATSRKLWKGLIRFNRAQAGPLHYSRTVLSARDEKGRLLGGLISQSWWQETYIELLWLASRARGAGLGGSLIKEAERRAQRRGSRVIHLSTYSFQALLFTRARGINALAQCQAHPKARSVIFTPSASEQKVRKSMA